jgi:hypothetical protein
MQSRPEGSRRHVVANGRQFVQDWLTAEQICVCFGFIAVVEDRSLWRKSITFGRCQDLSAKIAPRRAAG